MRSVTMADGSALPVSTPVLVMTFVDGSSVDDVDFLRARGHNLENVLRVGVRARLEAVLLDSVLHGDVHPGSLFVTDDGAWRSSTGASSGVSTRIHEPRS
jgi:predicted unusual protein kinase regulating ubiquinone biosynthesis (AarF/ABC1/UbiB family)